MSAAHEMPDGPVRGRLSTVIQPVIVKIYRLTGILALTAVLIGLISFLTVSIFYYFNRTWVRPVILSPEHARVIEASTTLNEARLRKSELEGERATAIADLAHIERLVVTHARFEAEATALLARGITTADQALLQRELGRATLERQAAIDRKAAVAARVGDLEGRIAEQTKLVSRLSTSPYVQATEGRRIVGFVPYQNLANVQPGVPLFGCAWGLLRCHKVGKVVSLLEGEVQDAHPHNDSLQRGVMVEVQLADLRAAEALTLFAGSKPLWWL